MAPTEIAIYIGLVWVAGVSLAGVLLVYGLLTPWWKSRTGIGFMCTQFAFFVLIGLTIARFSGYDIPAWLGIAAWIFMILAINLGITWNIIYKQFVQHRGDEVADKSQVHEKQEGVAHEVITGSIPVQSGDRNDRGIPR